MIMAKEIEKNNLDKTAQSYLQDTSVFLNGSYEEYYKRLDSIDSYLSSIRTMKSKLLTDMNFLWKYGVVTTEDIEKVRSIEV